MIMYDDATMYRQLYLGVSLVGIIWRTYFMNPHKVRMGCCSLWPVYLYPEKISLITAHM
jgi:hypothetical protein